MSDEMSVPKEMIQAVQATVQPVGDDGALNPMIERVAKAIADEIDRAKASGHFTHDLARAAIEAMREPTDEMVYAGKVEHTQFDYDYESHEANVIDIFYAMIDASLTAPTAEPGER